ncbi:MULTISPECIES: NAD-dependent succinate-semialdehyde dehydrogenase [Methylobacterium]|jgi:succinate-semialdehyde dehydrogenase/glutarate-semialdehyde dehydrogenase|uniref:NAD-dependent succinate-semialdehyde dehydrogenase n=1 Tax=Methylobacterium TaxID=407 RepID=UPI0008E586A6|nr:MULTISPECIES: NAD-dependent succinate-semialdehyde dehydrogenase [Methylobacterium]MBZ6413927.1 NAD-dependent succinate-semialdehyde dehydrogenase [Methylobacterium sp.]MBK3400912.1 NAD-dependent succinate-semialdehyde dehydrogenase [Methylobacterium ajmalii]MBK3410710.1 NAD-dependent succinate-semialdehyde dehydrogenase [Methylobacterium ajmalii]MBK3421199.1 NAD-dependent succinate-semialdehyde dehydrogenase [Methylobacterium ajmalii]SFF57477.1 succinate-semialdehyde dehydrogenase / glutar
MFPDVKLHIAGEWRAGSGGQTLPILNPATGETLSQLAVATRDDLDQALAAAERGFQAWRKVSAFERSKVLRKAANLMRERADEIARIMTLEQGKPVAEAKMEVLGGADTMDWFAEEGRRAYGRVIPPRAEGVMQLVIREPVGPVAAFTPWNFPINQAVRKVSAALCTGCSVILKGPEDTPASCTALIQALLDAGVPGDVLGLVFGDPATISSYLIPHPVIRKITFTGSTAIGKELAALAGQHMKRATMELGGHAPAIVFRDADVQKAVQVLGANKFRNAGQVCVAPTRFLVHDSVFDAFVDGFVGLSQGLKVGNGLVDGVKMGPLAHGRRIEAMEAFVADAEQKGATLRTGGKRIGNQGNFFEPTVFTDVPLDARIMNEEPFGPIAAIQRFSDDEEAFTEANRLPYGLAAYAYTRSAETATKLATRVESGMMSINHHGIALPETPFGGVKDSGYGSEGGSEAIEAYLNTKFVTQAGF